MQHRDKFLFARARRRLQSNCLGAAQWAAGERYKINMANKFTVRAAPRNFGLPGSANLPIRRAAELRARAPPSFGCARAPLAWPR